MKRTIFLLLLILSFFTLFAKGRKKNADNLPLLNTKWGVIEIFQNTVSYSADTAFIIFTDNYTLSGNLGCNLFFGEFNYGKKTIKIDYSGSTKMLCQDMHIETLFAKAIKDDITHYYIEKNNLYLLNKNKVVCKFRAIKTVENNY